MEFKVLGQLEARAGSRRLDLGGTRQETVLAMLLLNVGQVVSADRLLEALYGEDLPATARSQLQICVSGLRQLLAGPAGTVIATRAQGYVLQAGDSMLDHRRFAALAASARAARAAGELDRALAGYRDALRLWRGPALAELDSQLIRAAAARLDEDRITALEDRVAVELDLGRHHELAGELAELVTEYPLRERLRGQLMLALYRCGRTAEALAAYRQARQTMIDELGIEPGQQLQRLERDILRSDPALAPPGGPVPAPASPSEPVPTPPPPDGPDMARPDRRQVPRLLPTDIADFTGRDEQVGRVRRHLLSGAGLGVPVAVITGQGGVGKTCVAVHSAHALAARFPDGQLFVDLHGGSTNPVGPLQALERFLRALGVPGSQVPDGLDERAEVYRNLLADRKLLVVLDDVASEGQVWPLLPGAGPSAVLVTSRAGLPGLAGAEHVPAPLFDEGTSLELLGRIAGAGRVRAQPEATSAVAGRCGYLPLALRIAGARLAARPHRSIQQLADRLADEQRRLDELRHGELGVRASISVGYQGAGEQARCLFRRLALLDMPAFSGWVSVALLDGAVADAEDALDDLVRAQLIETSGGPDGQYRFHELIRVFAAERLAAEEPAAERDAALRRALGALLFLAEEAGRRISPGFSVKLDREPPRWRLPAPLVEELLGDPQAWGEREHGPLVAGIRQAARSGPAELCWDLAAATAEVFEASASFDDWRESAETGLATARAAGHMRGQAMMLDTRGALNLEQGRLGPARQDLEASSQMYREIGDDMGFAMVIRNLAIVDRLSGRLDEAVRCCEQALAALRKADNSDDAMVTVLINLVRVHLERGDYQEASKRLAEARRLGQGLLHRRVRAQMLSLSGDVSVAAGEPAQALTWYEQALAIVHDTGDTIGQSFVLRALGIARLRLGNLDAARTALQQARELSSSVGEQLTESRALLGLSEVALTSGDPQSAAAFARQAAGFFQDMGMPIYQERALTLLSSAQAALGDDAAAAAAGAQASVLRAGGT